MKYLKAILIALLAGHLGLFALRFAVTKSFVGGDSARNLMALRSLVLDGDLNFENEYRHWSEARSPYTGNPKIIATPEVEPSTGRISNDKPVGMSLLHAPFFLVAHALTGGKGDGYSGVYQVLCALGSLLFGLAAVWFTFRLGSIHFPFRAAVTGTLVTWLGTPLVYYLTVEPLMSHAASAFLVALLFFLWHKHRERGWKTWLLVGAVGGLGMITRYFNGIYLLPIFWNGARRKRFDQLIGFALGALPFLALQGWVNFHLRGSWLTTGYPADFSLLGRFHWEHLFDAYYGLIVTSPLVATAIYGLYKERRRLNHWPLWTLGFAWYFLGVVGPSTLPLASFGNRYFLEAFPLFALGSMVLAERLPKKKQKIVFGSAVAFELVRLVLYCARLLPEPYVLS